MKNEEMDDWTTNLETKKYENRWTRNLSISIDRVKKMSGFDSFTPSELNKVLNALAAGIYNKRKNASR